MKERKIFSLQTKIILLFAIGSLILLSLLGTFIINITQDSYMDALDTSYANETGYFSSEISSWLLEVKGVVESEAALANTMDYKTEGDEMTNTLVAMTNSNDAIQMCYVAFSDNTLYNGVGWVPAADFKCTERSWYINAVAANGEVVYSDPYVDSSTGQVCVTISKYFNTGSCEGVAACDLLTGTLFAGIDDMVLETGNAGDYVIITTADGGIIYHPNAEYMSSSDELVNLYDLLDGGYKNSLDNDDELTDYNGVSVYLTSITNSVTGWQVIYVSPTEYYDSATDSIKTFAIVLIVVFVIIATIASVVISWVIARPIKLASKDVTEIVDEISSGHGDLTKKITPHCNDEIRILVEDINALIAAMGRIISNVQGITGSVTSASAEIEGSIDTANSQVISISDAMQQMSATTQETTASVSLVKDQIDDIAGLISNVYDQASESVKESGQIISKVKGMQDVFANTVTENNEKTSTMTAQLEAALEAAKDVDKIKALTEDILSISSQTNLLALNASIEAARAGEAGRGFAVVADEIRQLADSTRETASSIQVISANVINSVSELADKSRMIANAFADANSQSGEDVASMSASYMEDIEKLSKLMENFAEASSSIQKSMNDMLVSMDTVNQAVSDNASGIASVADSTSELSKSLNEAVEKTSGNVSETTALSTEINKFKV